MNTFWKDRRVLLTGHTGFKGAWLTLWLRRLGAAVAGISLDTAPRPCLLEQFGLVDEIDQDLLDIRSSRSLWHRVKAIQPEVIFHLAAQPLVRRSYQEPLETWTTNVTGTLNLLEALRQLSSPFVAVVITTDKVYLNHEWEYGYREHDPLGGHDPYSSSKAAVEIAVTSWRQSFFTNPVVASIATARAGNVLGGGDWSEDRILPDIVRYLTRGQPIALRNPQATRPWQHVLEPLAGYLKLAESMRIAQLEENVPLLRRLGSPWNFGPLPESNRSVQQLVEAVLKVWPGSWRLESKVDSPHEAQFLGLGIDKACRLLNWYPRWNFEECVLRTVDWYRRVQNGEQARHVAEEQIDAFECSSGN